MRVLALAGAAVLALAAPAHALPILSTVDAADLEEQLTEAREQTGVCFGWRAQIVGAGSGLDAGGAPPGTCERQLVLDATLTYTSEWSESEDSASMRLLATGLPGADVDELQALVGRGAGDLLGEDDDKALFELAAALPLYAAQLDPSIGPALPPIETGTAAPGAQVGSVGSDFLRQHGLKLGLGIGLGLLALFLILTGRQGRPRPKEAPWTTS